MNDRNLYGLTISGYFLLGLILVEHTLFIVRFVTTFLGELVETPFFLFFLGGGGGKAKSRVFGAIMVFNTKSKCFI